jgi:hypothetical protein
MEWIGEYWTDVLIAVISAIGGAFIGFRIGVNNKQKLSSADLLFWRLKNVSAI